MNRLLKTFLPLVLWFPVAGVSGEGSDSAATFSPIRVGCVWSVSEETRTGSVSDPAKWIDFGREAGADVILLSAHGYFSRGAPEETRKRIETFAGICRGVGVSVVTCLDFPSGSKVFHKALVFGPGGDLAAEAAEAFPKEGEGYSGGHRLVLFRIGDVPGSLLIGEDIRYPELARIPVLGGVRILFYLADTSEVRGTDPQVKLLARARALENGVFVVVSAGKESCLIRPDGTLAEEDCVLREKGSLVGVFFTIDAGLTDPGGVETGATHPALTSFWREGRRVLETQNRSFFHPGAPEGPFIRVASISYTPKKWDKETNMKRTEELIREAAAHPGVELIVLPEGVLEGYVINQVDRAPEEKKAEMEKRFLEIAEPMDGPYLRRYRSLAAELGVLLCVGFAERDGDVVYNTVVLIGPDGRIIGKYRKTHLAQGYGHPSFYKTGKDFPAFETEHGKVGMIICYDRQLPEPARLVRLAGAQIILVPSYGGTGEWNDQLIRMRARENGVPLVFCHPEQSLFVDDGGHVLANVTATDHIEVCDVPLPDKVTHRVSHRRPELYRGFVEIPVRASWMDEPKSGGTALRGKD